MYVTFSCSIIDLPGFVGSHETCESESCSFRAIDIPEKDHLTLRFSQLSSPPPVPWLRPHNFHREPPQALAQT